MSRLDLVIFGATGFTGKHAVQEALRLSQKTPFTWGVAGRSESKLNAVLKEIEDKTGVDLSKTARIVSDVSEPASLQTMCARARVLVNCCGPYSMYGEPVVVACIQNGTHHVDVSGEPQFIESMQLKYDKQAREAGVFIVSACGFDSIPADMGTVFLEQNFGGTLNSIVSYLSMQVPPEHRGKPSIHYGTWHSLVESIYNWQHLTDIRKKLFPERLPALQPKVEAQGILHKHSNRWYMPFPGSDASVVYRTQRHLYENGGKRPVQYKPYVSIGNWFLTVAMLVGSVILYAMLMTNFTKNLLLKWPRLFTLGMITQEGPTDEVMNSSKFTFKLIGEGWDNTVTDITTKPPNKKMVVKVSGVNPGYGATVTALVFSGLTLLKEADKIPFKGGVLTPGLAFAKTNLIKNLNENNLLFEIEK